MDSIIGKPAPAGEADTLEQDLELDYELEPEDGAGYFDEQDLDSEEQPEQASLAPQSEIRLDDEGGTSVYEPFLQDWYPVQPQDTAGKVVLNNRQLAIIGFIIVGTLALMSMLAFAAGRATGEPNRVVMVESAEAAPVSPAPLTAPEPLQNAAPAPKPLPGVRLSYWQVGALDAGMAEVSRKYLAENGLPVRLDPVAGSSQVRVLVGPIMENDNGETKARLDALGFQSFLKKF